MTGWRGGAGLAQQRATLLLAPALNAACALAGQVLTASVRRIARTRPDLFERLGPYRDTLYALEPSDLPVRFLLWPRGQRGSVRAVAPGALVCADATVRGRTTALLALFDGALDADAQMFARGVSVSGDTAALVALRNTLEASGLSIADLAGAPGPAAQALNALWRTLLARDPSARPA